MKESRFSGKELAQLREISNIFIRVAKKPVRDLHLLMDREIMKVQPVLPDHCRLLYQMKKFDAQFEDLIRISVVIYWYYQPLLPAHRHMVDGALYSAMEKKSKLFNERFIGQSREESKNQMEGYLMGHPSGCLIRLMHGLFITKPWSSIKKLEIADRAFLLYKFFILLDCFEHLRAEGADN